MGIYLKYYPEENFLFSVFYGKVTNNELSNHISNLLQDDYAEPGKTGLVVLCKNSNPSPLSFKSTILKNIQHIDL